MPCHHFFPNFALENSIRNGKENCIELDGTRHITSWIYKVIKTQMLRTVTIEVYYKLINIKMQIYAQGKQGTFIKLLEKP
jgi:hypothetical protein